MVGLYVAGCGMVWHGVGKGDLRGWLSLVRKKRTGFAWGKQPLEY
jgi:hypothetical protein